VHTIGKAA